MQRMLPVAMLPIWNRFLACTMLNWMRQCDRPKISKFGNSQQRVCGFLSSVTKTPLKCQEKASCVLKIWQNHLAAGSSPRTPLGRLQRSPRLPSWWREGWLSLPKNPTLVLGFFGPRFPPLPPNWNPGFAPAIIDQFAATKASKYMCNFCWHVTVPSASSLSSSVRTSLLYRQHFGNNYGIDQ